MTKSLRDSQSNQILEMKVMDLFKSDIKNWSLVIIHQGRRGMLKNSPCILLRLHCKGQNYCHLTYWEQGYPELTIGCIMSHDTSCALSNVVYPAASVSRTSGYVSVVGYPKVWIIASSIVNIYADVFIA